jgi:uncharacterized iron-regulated membrane protein
MRRILFQAHRWVGLIAALYILVISISGAALVYRINLQRAFHPHLFTAASGVPADAATIMESVARAYPDHRLSGVDAPTTSRPTYLAYVTLPGAFKTVLIEPITARVLGELPERSAVRVLQELHYDLLSGRTGRIVNGTGALAIAFLAVTGASEWWRRGRNRQRGRLAREVHRTTGIFGLVLILMWAITGAYFAFPSAFRAIIGSVSPLTAARTPQSEIRRGSSVPTWRQIIDAARRRHPDLHVARVVLPFGERASWLVMFARLQPTPAYTELESVFVDQYSGAVIDMAAQRTSFGDRVMRAMAPLHVGSFGGTSTRVAWFLFGLAPAVLVVTGTLLWAQRRRRGDRP